MECIQLKLCTTNQSICTVQSCKRTLLLPVFHIYNKTPSLRTSPYCTYAHLMYALCSNITIININVMQIYELVMRRRLHLWVYCGCIYSVSIGVRLVTVHCHHKYQAPLFHKFTCVLYTCVRKGVVCRICKY